MITFLFTDIEGSTLLWECHPERMARALECHDDLCRATVEAFGGRVVKMIGDGLHAVFSEPAAAMSTALKLQQGMVTISADHDISIKIRCGLHVGEAQARDDDYFGGAVNRAARIMASAHGGQVLLSQAIVESAAGRLPEGTTVAPIGRVRLRDLAEPVDIWQLCHADLPPTFPPLRSLDSTPNNLPRQLTSFIGREAQIVEVQALVRKTRLITLTGAGGCGKTRLALQVAADMLDTFADGVWLVELAALVDGALLWETVAAVFGLKEESARTWKEIVIEHLAPRKMLVVLDNAEHILASCAEFADVVARASSGVVILSTSRQRLGLSAETAYRVQSLSTPEPGRDQASAALLQYESVRLFAERARYFMPRFTITDDNAAAVASICRRLDGIPLALELAAARVRAMSVEEINQRLDQRFRLVTGGRRAAPRRQQTLWALIDWSYDLLDDSEKVVFCRASVFAGGWMLEGAERVCAGDRVEEWEVLDLLTSLADKNLIVIDERAEATRYRMLETVREYASEQLENSKSDAGARDRHLAYFLEFATAAEPEFGNADQKTWLDRAEAEHDNVRSALAWASGANGDGSLGLALASALGRWWTIRGHMGEGRAWFARLLATVPHRTNAAVRTQALSTAGNLAYHQGDLTAAHALHSECVSIRRTLGRSKALSTSLNNLGSVELDRGNYAAARAHLEESLAIVRELNDARGIAASLTNLGNVAADQGDRQAARTMYEEALAIRRVSGDQTGIHAVLHNLGSIAYDERDYTSARRFLEESLAIKRLLVDRRGVAATLVGLGNTARDQGDRSAASGYYSEAMPTFLALGDARGIAALLEGVAEVALLADRLDVAACLWGGADRLRQEIGAPMPLAERSRYEDKVAAARCALGDASFLASWQAGRAMGREAIAHFALEQATKVA